LAALLILSWLSVELKKDEILVPNKTKIHKNEHEKKVHKLNHHEQQDLIATPWQMWERADEDEYIEPDYISKTRITKKAQKNEKRNKYG
jgi:hypothetical protein